ncbi:MAG: fatty acid desaturase [Deltaproteobacteria bacterium]|nr:fatty acid desaturase [Deltaproteobacteria bacterium]
MSDASDTSVTEMRSGAELNKATKAFAVDERARTWRLWFSTLAVLLLCWLGALLLPQWWARLAAAILTGLCTVRAFIFFHDYLHRAIWVDSRLGGAFMSAVGFLVLAPPSVWRETHNYHHKHNAKLVGSAIGSYPVVTAAMYRGMSEKQRKAYRLVRHPLTMLTGYLTLFALGMCVAPFKRDPKQHWGGPVALALHAAILAGLFAWGGWQAALFGGVIPLAVACAAGSYLFYAQHNFPEIELKGRRDWDYTHAALKSSSLFEMSALMHWFTGEIGYHHVHHLNHRIPFYRLRDAMEAIPELQSPGRTSWRLADVWACLKLDVWDADSGRMVSLRELPPPAAEAPSLKAA